MIPGSVTLPTAYRGDTYEPITFTITENNLPIDLTASTCAMEFRDAVTDSLALRISNFTSPAINIRTTPPILFPKAGNFKFDFQVCFTSGEIVTYAQGQIMVTNDVTRNCS